MPYINLKVAGSLTREQKKEISAHFADILFKIAGKKPETTYVVIDEVDRDNWGVGGELLSDN